MALYDRTCLECGSSFKGGPRAWYCPICRDKRNKERNRKRVADGRKPKRPLGSIDQCQVCGKDYIVNSGLQKYCPKCAHEHLKENGRKKSLKYYYSKKESINHLRKINRRTMLPCPICGKEYWSVGGKLACCNDHKREVLKNRTVKYKSGHAGVSWDGYARSWKVYITKDRTVYKLGRYKYLAVAIRIRKKAESLNGEDFDIWLKKLKYRNNARQYRAGYYKRNKEKMDRQSIAWLKDHPDNKRTIARDAMRVQRHLRPEVIRKRWRDFYYKNKKDELHPGQ